MHIFTKVTHYKMVLHIHIYMEEKYKTIINVKIVVTLCVTVYFLGEIKGVGEGEELLVETYHRNTHDQNIHLMVKVQLRVIHSS